ncbi:MAG: hypothetical protein Q8940_19750, partial [Bacteroidota bacterium]|nr:hypothetical protein [Bacteroidota bacterium]
MLVLIIALLCGLLLITLHYLPKIKDLAGSIIYSKKVPSEIRGENERIIRELDSISCEIERLDEKRRYETSMHINKIEKLKRSISILERESVKIESSITEVHSSKTSSFTEQMTCEQVYNELKRILLLSSKEDK